MAKQKSKPNPAAAIVDPVLGKLTRDKWGQWQAATRALKQLRKQLSIDLGNADGDAAPPGPALAAVRSLVAHPGGLEALLTDVMWAYYQDVVVKVYRAQLNPKDAALTTPHLDEPADVWPLVGDDLSLSPEPADDGTLRLVLRGNCEWDPEHGFELAIVDGKYARDD
jgi:hypothetical protein